MASHPGWWLNDDDFPASQVACLETWKLLCAVGLCRASTLTNSRMSSKLLYWQHWTKGTFCALLVLATKNSQLQSIIGKICLFPHGHLITPARRGGGVIIKISARSNCSTTQASARFASNRIASHRIRSLSGTTKSRLRRYRMRAGRATCLRNKSRLKFGLRSDWIELAWSKFAWGSIQI